MTISVIGLGKLGASMAAAMASRGFSVIGCDSNPRVVAALQEGRAPVVEPQLQELITAHRDRLRATTDIAVAVEQSELSFVIVPTPSDETGGFSIEYARAACEGIGRALATKSAPHHVALSSTVLPGSSRHGIIPAIERASGKRCGRDFNFSYTPEFIALGSVIRDFLHPDFTLVGEFDSAGGAEMEEFYHQLLPDPKPCRRMSLENAELAKLALNAYVTTKITFANMLADFCERLPGGDARAVCDALGADARIGRRYLNGGPSFGGPCFPRDNRALTAFAKQIGVAAPLPACIDENNEALHERLVHEIVSRVPAKAAIAVLGLAYKPDTAVVEASPGIELCRRFAEDGRPVLAFDPLANETARAVLPKTVQFCGTVHECLCAAEVAVITTPDPLFRDLTPADWQAARAGLIVFDLWSKLPDFVSTLPNVQVFRRGEGRDEARATEIFQRTWGRSAAR
jgi:UDPglucose 6-dehydrogenase